MKQYERHGQTKGRKRTPTYLAWRNMIQRCTGKNRPDYYFYGGRGIAVCDRWQSFARFLEDMGERQPETSLDRIDNSQGYQPDNCRWATKDQQMQNTRATKLISYKGKTMGMAAWGRLLGLSPSTVSQRFRKGLPIELALKEFI